VISGRGVFFAAGRAKCSPNVRHIFRGFGEIKKFLFAETRFFTKKTSVFSNFKFLLKFADTICLRVCLTGHVQ
jgi:hypothetical protein